MMATVQSQFPAHTFRATSAVDAHHRIARYSWALVGTDGTVAIKGLDVADAAAEHHAGQPSPSTSC